MKPMRMGEVGFPVEAHGPDVGPWAIVGGRAFRLASRHEAAKRGDAPWAVPAGDCFGWRARAFARALHETPSRPGLGAQDGSLSLGERGGKGLWGLGLDVSYDVRGGVGPGDRSGRAGWVGARGVGAREVGASGRVKERVVHHVGGVTLRLVVGWCSRGCALTLRR